MRDLVFEFFLPDLRHPKTDAIRIMNMVCDITPELTPEVYNTYEPVNKNFDRTRLEDAFEGWHFSFFWKRKKPSVAGVIFLGNAQPERPTHTHLIVESKPEKIDQGNLTRLVCELSKNFRPDLGFIHVLSKAEIESKQLVMQSTFVLKKSLPSLYWATVFGAPYVKLFGKERLLSTPVAVVKELADDLVYLQLTDDLMDNRIRPEQVETVRQAAEKHLDSNVFFDPHSGPDHIYRTPEFYIFDKL